MGLYGVASANCLCLPDVVQQLAAQGALLRVDMPRVWAHCHWIFDVGFFWWGQAGGLCPF